MTKKTAKLGTWIQLIFFQKVTLTCNELIAFKQFSSPQKKASQLPEVTFY
ncbi:MAG: hypothetical protein ACI9WT_001794 [Flavobacterium sp.]|jgi:hypothetical protein